MSSHNQEINSYEQEINKYKIGTHIHKNGKFLDSIKTFYKNNPFDLPIQIFTSSPKTWTSPARNSKDELETKNYVTQNSIQLYIHSCYLINLAKPSIQNAIDTLQNDLDIGSAIGAKGVVVHVGKSLKTSITDSINNMETNMLKLSIHEGCPLLLETPAKQGTELLTTVETFKEFTQRFETHNTIYKKYGICVDTCHIFASGYDPMEYINKLTNSPKETINLIHLNDSKEPKGSKKDRHEYLFSGNGHITKETLFKVAELEIPCVTE